MISEVERQGKSDIRMARTGTHKYNTRSSTNRINHVTTFKNTPKIFIMDKMYISKTHIGTHNLAFTCTPKDTITVDSLANHINCENTRKILGYRDPINMDAPVWNNSMCNKLGRLYQGWKEHVGTDTIHFILYK